ncbi:MAG: type I restriction endonuclease, partial [Pseudomonadota bacterium]|nr:type I restriction endonuclease [Pseudomonadota bacterium]
MSFTEASLEQVILELLDAQGYPHVHGATLTRKPEGVLIRADLEAFLRRQYAAEALTDHEVSSIIHQLEGYSAADLYDSNRAIMKLVSDGLLLKREDRNKKDLYIQLLDYSALPEVRRPDDEQLTWIGSDNKEYATGNIVKLVNQLEIEGYEKRIPDAILYINGLPLAVFEFKSTVREDATIFNAFEQLTVRYKRAIPELFKYNALCVISDGVNSKMGSFFAPYEFW